jgi:hypothetical protein
LAVFDVSESKSQQKFTSTVNNNYFYTSNHPTNHTTNNPIGYPTPPPPMLGNRNTRVVFPVLLERHRLV